jgi:hypothetical protein
VTLGWGYKPLGARIDFSHDPALICRSYWDDKNVTKKRGSFRFDEPKFTSESHRPEMDV